MTTPALRSFRHTAIATVLAFLALAGSARASITWLAAVQVSSGSGVYSSIAYDDKHHVYLVTWEYARQVWARFHDASGNPLGSAFAVATALQSFAGVPKVAYTQGTNDDVFLIAFSSDAMIYDRSKNIFGQLLRYNGQGSTGAQLVGGNFDLSQFSRDAAHVQTAFDVKFNAATRNFVVAWDELVNNAPADAYVRVITTAGVPVASDVNINTPLSAQSQGATAIAVSTDHNRILAAWQGDHPTQSGVIGLFAAILDGNTGAPVAGATFIELTRGGFPIEPDAVYLPDRQAFLVMWTQMSASTRWVEGRIVSATGVPLTGVYTMVSGRSEGAVDSAYNATTHTTLLTAMSGIKLIRGVELNGEGTPTTAAYNLSTVASALTGDAGGSFNPHVVAGANGTFGTAYTLDYQRTILELYQGASAGGNPSPSVSNTKLFLDSPSNGSIVQTSFAIAGWAVDLGSPAGSGTGISVVHAYAYPVAGGSPVFLGAAIPGVGRADISTYFGRSDFTNAGFGLSASLPAGGTYDIVVYAFSTVAGGFNSSASARVTVSAPVANPKMFIDSPGVGQTVPTTFAVGGWAVDLGAPSGSGVSVVHVWAYPTNGAAPIFFGATAMNISRPDVGAHFGNSRFSTSGYNVQGSLPQGNYNLAVFAFSTVTGTFNNAAAVPIAVR